MAKPLRVVIWCAVSSEAQAVREEKVSLEMQERLGREFAARESGDVVKVFVWDGHSRDNPDVIDALDQFAAAGRMQYHELRAMWKARQFDVLWMYTHSRGGRSFTLMSWVIENVVRSGARVYVHGSGWIDEKTYPFQIAMGGAAAAGERQKFVEQRKAGMHRRAERGLPVSSRIPISHVLIRNAKGKAERLEVNESKRRLFDDMATLVLEGVGWNDIADQLYLRHGHVDEVTGQTYAMSLPYRLLNNPLTWGHIAQHHKRTNGWQIGLWVFDEHEPVPEGVIVYRNVVPPVYTGEQAEAVKAEMRRRSTSIAGRSVPQKTHRYAGLMVCGTCGGAMVVSYGRDGRKRHYLYCNHAYYNETPGRTRCSDHKFASYSYLDHYLDVLLRRLIEGEALPVQTTNNGATAERLAQIEAELAEVRSRIDRLIVEQSIAPDGVQVRYRDAVRAMSEREAILVNQFEQVRALTVQQSAIAAQSRAAVEDIAGIGMDRFWNLSDTEINQLLHRILGDHQFVVRDGKIIALSVRRRNKWQKRKRSVEF